ncbi:AT-hook motif nuclear-localized protein 28-like [Lotus japonicus]|uniref:AT-hook motif nuclear-localized protein 28-like n=1 Tax=Lotus japonicus TaxID=34305 RepID=UPI00258F7E1D|nr:AT-hook motif nuclear-localized protein 28-like [Lotus japonicus]
MAGHYGIPMLLSPRPYENPSRQHTPNTSVFGFHLQPPHPNQQERSSSSSNRTPGRPRGSKNKPKPQMPIPRDNDMKSIIIDVGVGHDVMEAIAQVANHHNTGVTVVHAAGTISNVTLSHPLTQAPAAFIAYGPFILLGLSGSYVTPTALNVGFPSSLPSSIPNPLSSEIHSNFKISLSSFQGKVLSGNVAGEVIAANGGVNITALLVKNPEYYSFGVATECDIEEEDVDNPLGGEGGGDREGASGSGGVNCASGFGMSGFNED